MQARPGPLAADTSPSSPGRPLGLARWPPFSDILCPPTPSWGWTFTPGSALSILWGCWVKGSERRSL